MQRSELRESLYVFHDFCIHQCRISMFLTTMHHSVADSMDLIKVLHHTLLLHLLKQMGDCLIMALDLNLMVKMSMKINDTTAKLLADAVDMDAAHRFLIDKKLRLH